MDKFKMNKSPPIILSIRFGLLALEEYIVLRAFAFPHNSWPVFMPPHFEFLW